MHFIRCLPAWLLIPAALCVLLAGCARFPEGEGPTSLSTATFYVQTGGSINPNYHYFIAIDIYGGGNGPLPLFPTVPGQGWLTSADPANPDPSQRGATHFVEFYQGQFVVYQIISLAPFQYQSIGAPLRASVGPNYYTCTLNLAALASPGASVTSLDVNFINADFPYSVQRLIDGLGQSGGNYVNIDVRTNRTFSDSDTGYDERAGDVLDQNRSVQPITDLTRPLDTIDWTITINTGG